MKNGWRCFKTKRVFAALLLLAMLGAAGWWWLTIPRTPEALFRARCATCHELRHAKLCSFSKSDRGAIVDTMRRLHGAAEVINEAQARVIIDYLENDLPCP